MKRRVRHWVIALRARMEPVPDDGGLLIRPTPFDRVVYDIGCRWHCTPLRGELPSAHRHRLALHLTTLQIAIEDDLATVLGERL